jgi:hypothetical protein
MGFVIWKISRILAQTAILIFKSIDMELHTDIENVPLDRSLGLLELLKYSSQS